jgi:glycosyltransferase involved in cell wall biosynthesis
MSITLAPDTDAQNRLQDYPEGIDRSNRRLRIIHAVSSLKVGGMEQFVLRLADAQQRRGHPVSILAIQDGPLREKAQQMGLSVRVLGGKPKVARVIMGIRTLSRFRPDIVHAHNTTSLHYAVLAKWIGSAKVVLTNHGQGLGPARVPSRREWQRTDAVIAVSQAVAARMDASQVGERLSVIHNGITIAASGQDRLELRNALCLSERLVGTIAARIDHLKGHETLLKALALLRASNIAVTLLIAGDGTERANMERLAQELSLGPEWVRFLGFRPDVPDLLAASDFFVLPSLTEGLPLSILEAMAHRLPVVATPVGGIPEIIEDGKHGLLVPVQDPQALADAITRLAGEPGLCNSLGEAAYDRVRDAFSFDEMVRRYQSLYDRLQPGLSGIAAS